MHDPLIAWMMSGGNRFETIAERKDRENARAMREVRPDVYIATDLRRVIAPIRARALSVLGIATAALSTPSTTRDCCGA